MSLTTFGHPKHKIKLNVRFMFTRAANHLNRITNNIQKRNYITAHQNSYYKKTNTENKNVEKPNTELTNFIKNKQNCFSKINENESTPVAFGPKTLKTLKQEKSEQIKQKGKQEKAIIKEKIKKEKLHLNKNQEKNDVFFNSLKKTGYINHCVIVSEYIKKSDPNNYMYLMTLTHKIPSENYLKKNNLPLIRWFCSAGVDSEGKEHFFIEWDLTKPISEILDMPINKKISSILNVNPEIELKLEKQQKLSSIHAQKDRLTVLKQNQKAVSEFEKSLKIKQVNEQTDESKSLQQIHDVNKNPNGD